MSMSRAEMLDLVQEYQYTLSKHERALSDLRKRNGELFTALEEENPNHPIIQKAKS